ncbi:11850_t:CDS:2 [Ambispora gerdemannii]|uniref:11850_t:CDS:1 n=1 Tax=Ambispora gerdemannii TaxID=144530 RepID=A0A9N9A2M8_9GLOM|nr:11850_t:CDS:2 [Ambispora gerdemannii]
MPKDKGSGRHIAILGGGIIGASIAYYITLLNKDPALKVTVVEQTGIACAASGKAAGFLAREWCNGGPQEDLAHKSFEMHCELAKKLDGKNRYDWRVVDTFSVSASVKAVSNKPTPTDWFKRGVVTKFKEVGNIQTTAQLHPLKFTQVLIQEAESRGAKVLIARAEGFIFDGNKITSIRLSNGNILDVDDVIIAMGPWSGKALNWLIKKSGRSHHLPDITGQRAHSIILRPPALLSPHVCFVTLNTGRKFVEPEIYPRPDGNVYIFGELDGGELPETADEYIPSEIAVQNLKSNIHILSPDVLGVAPVVMEQCCFMPIPEDNRPLIGKVPWLEGIYIASGHSVWGILNSTGTGLVMAEMLLKGQAKSIDVRKLSPMRSKVVYY